MERPAEMADPRGNRADSPQDPMWWQVTDEVLNEAGVCGLPLHKRIWFTVAHRDPLRTHRLDLIAMDAALSATRDYLTRRKNAPLLNRLAGIGQLADQQARNLRAGSRITLPWQELDVLRGEAGLEPSMKLSNKQ